MSSRYTNIGTTNRWDGKRVYKTTSYPVINPSNSDVVIVSNEEDYLDSLALKYYGDATLWWIIALANNLGKGRLNIPAGINLRIPTNVNYIISQFNQLNQ